jgi:PAS domain S-box-containing protein
VAVEEVLDLSPDAVVGVRPDGMIVLVSQQAERLFGYSRAELLGKAIELLVPQRFRAGHGAHRNGYFKDPRMRPMGADLELFGLRRDGSEFPAEISLSAIATVDGTVGLAAVRDITQRKRAEESFQKLLELAPDAIVGIGEDGGILVVNRQAEELFGYAREELHDRPVETLIPERFHGAHTGHRTGYFANPRTREMGAQLDLYGVRRDGSEFPAEISLSAIPWEDGTLATAAIRDISDRVKRDGERKALQEELEARQRESLEAQLNQARRLESVGQLAGGVAHDFNNLLAVVLNYADFVIAELDEDSAVAEDVRAIRAAAQRGVALIRQLLLFSRREVLQPEALDLNDVVSTLEDMLGRTLGEQIELHLQLDPELWTVVADRGQIEQVLVNLAVNARDAMPDGGRLQVETANVSLASEEGEEDSIEDYTRLSVSDTGAGMEPDVVKRAFEPFFSTKPKGRGTGLGLATVYAIVQELGGKVWLYSELGEGTTLKVHLPRSDAEPVRKREQDREPLRGGGETILVVEDADDVREMTRRILARSGYEVREARSGAEALELFSSGAVDPDLVITDVIMPGMPGTELAEHLRELGLKTKVLFMSGYTGEVLERKRVAQGEAAFIEKPFAATDLLEKVHGLLHGPS